MMAVDVPPVVFDRMSMSSDWIGDDDKFKQVLSTGSPQISSYLHLIRERLRAIEKLILLFNIKDNRITLLNTVNHT